MDGVQRSNKQAKAGAPGVGRGTDKAGRTPVGGSGKAIKKIKKRSLLPRPRRRKKASHDSIRLRRVNASGIVDPGRRVKTIRVSRETGRPVRRRKVSAKGKAVLAAGAILLVFILIAVLPWFRARRVEVSGNEWIPADDIIKAAEIRTGQHFLSVGNGGLWNKIIGRSAEAEARLKEALPDLSEVRVAFHFPSTMLISVTTRPATAQIISGSDRVIVDQAGYIKTVVTPDQMASSEEANTLPIIVDLSEGEQNAVDVDLVPGRRLSRRIAKIAQDCAAYEEVTRKLDEATADGMHLANDLYTVTTDGDCFVFTLDMTDEEAFSEAATNVLREVRVKIDFEQRDLEAHLRWLRYALRSGAMNDLGNGVLDLTHIQRVFVPDKVAQERQKMVDNMRQPAVVEEEATEVGGAEERKPGETKAGETTAGENKPEETKAVTGEAQVDQGGPGRQPATDDGARTGEDSGGDHTETTPETRPAVE